MLSKVIIVAFTSCGATKCFETRRDERGTQTHSVFGSTATKSDLRMRVRASLLGHLYGSLRCLTECLTECLILRTTDIRGRIATTLDELE